MCFVENFIDGAYASRKIALINLKEHQKNTVLKLRVVKRWCKDCFLYYVVY